MVMIPGAKSSFQREKRIYPGSQILIPEGKRDLSRIPGVKSSFQREKGVYPSSQILIPERKRNLSRIPVHTQGSAITTPNLQPLIPTAQNYSLLFFLFKPISQPSHSSCPSLPVASRSAAPGAAPRLPLEMTISLIFKNGIVPLGQFIFLLRPLPSAALLL